MCSNKLKTKIQHWAESSPLNPDINFLRSNLRWYISQYHESLIDFLYDLEEETGYKIGREAMRRFIDNKNTHTPDEEFRGSPKTWIATALHLIQVDYLTLDEIIKGRYDELLLPTRLADFYNDSTDVDLANYVGKYSFQIKYKHYIFEHYLIIKQEKRLPYLKVEERSSQPETRNKSKVNYGFFHGYAIATDPHNLLILLTTTKGECKKTYLSNSPININLRQYKFTYQYACHHSVLEDETLQEELKVTSKEQDKSVLFQYIEDFSSNLHSNKDNIERGNEKMKKPVLKDSPFTRNIRFIKRKEDVQIREKGLSDLMVPTYDRSKLTNEEWELGIDLASAAQAGDLAAVKQLVAKGADVNYPETISGMTSFQLAAKHQNWPMLEFLLETKKCNLLQRDNQGWLTSSLSTLSSPSEQAHLWRDKLQQLEKEQGENFGIYPGEMGNEPFDDSKHLTRQFWVATSNNNEELARKHLQSGAQPNYFHERLKSSTLHELASNGMWNLLEEVLHTNQCNHLLTEQNSQGLRPSDCAQKIAGNKEWGDKLRELENTQLQLVHLEVYKPHHT